MHYAIFNMNLICLQNFKLVSLFELLKQVNVNIAFEGL